VTGVVDFVDRFRTDLEASVGTLEEGSTVVAFSGGLDSCVLLHLLRFHAMSPSDLRVGHFDHRMRKESAADADWVRGLCQAWDLPVTIGCADRVPTSEDAARNARYAFLESLRADVGATRVVTAHHADDQAETVLFRIFRGTGIEGLRGIPTTRPPGIARPLLGFWREELEAYAAKVGLVWREDESNEDVRYARNVIRRQILPNAEAGVAPGARRALVRLARLAEENEAAWRGALPDVLSRLDVRNAGSSISWDSAALERLPPALRARVIRHLAAELGRVLDEVGTRRVVEFAGASRSGNRVDLGGGFALCRELDRLSIERSPPESSDVPLRISGASSGIGEAVLGGRRVDVEWTCEGDDAPSDDREVFAVDDLAFPLTVRAREPGDRIVLQAGTRKLKKLLLEARIPSRRRGQVPLLVDGAGRVLWVAGVARTSTVRAEGVGSTFRIRMG